MNVNRPSGSGPAPSAGPMEDAALIAAVAAGDQHAAGELVWRYEQIVRRFLRRLTGRADVADDLAQDTFVRMLRYADRYDPKYPMRTWLLTIARRLAINRARRANPLGLADESAWLADDCQQPDQQVEQEDQRQMIRTRLRAAMTQLTEPQRQAVILFHTQSLSVQEVAAVMELPVGTVKSHLHRARAALRKILADDGELEMP